MAASTSFTRSNLQRFVVKTFIMAVNLYGIILLFLIAAKFLIGEQWELIAISNSFLHLLLIGGFVWLAVCLARRRWPLAALSLIPAVFFVVSYGMMFVPNPVSGSPDARTLSLLTYNLHSEQMLIDPMADVVREANADVVALQEVSREVEERFSAEFATLYPYQAWHTIPDGAVIGQAVMSRYPILESDYWRNEPLNFSLGHQQVIIDFDGTAISLYNTHPIHPILKLGRIFAVELRTNEIQSVLDRADVDSNSVLIAGDFNMSDQSEDYRTITAGYTDAYRAAGWGLGFTFPDFSSRNAVPGERGSLPLRPIVRLDYIFHSDDFRALEARVWPTSGGSDHRPLLAQFEVLEN